MASRKLADFADDFCLVVNSPFSGDSFEEFVYRNGFSYPQAHFNSRSWNLAKPKIIELQKKLESSGKTLEQLKVKIRLGIATGSNEAFLIDEEKKRELCEEDSANAAIINGISSYRLDLSPAVLPFIKAAFSPARNTPLRNVPKAFGFFRSLYFQPVSARYSGI